MTEKFTASRRDVLRMAGLVTFAGGLTASGLTACSSSKPASTSAAAHGVCGTNTAINLGTNGDANNFNPILVVDSDGYWRTDLMFDPLVLVNPTSLQAVPHLATSWTISPDGRTYTFKLDPRAKFWDGHPLTANDVEFTVLSMLQKNYTGPFQTYWSRLDGADAVIAGTAQSLPGLKVIDDHTIEMTLTKPYAGFLTVIARNLKPLPMHLLQNSGPLTTTSSYSHNPIGSGPYKFKSYVPGSSFSVVVNQNYWGGQNCLGNITQTVIPDMNTLAQGVLSGQFNGTIVAPQNDLASMRQNGRLAVFVAPSFSGEAWYFNNRRAPWKGNQKLRQAMASAVDFITFQKKFMYVANPVPATFYEYASWAYDAQAGAVPTYDPDRAKSLLAEAGYPHGNGLSITIITNAGNEFRAQEETYIQAAMATLGVKVTVQQAEWGQFITAVQSGNFDTAALSTTSSIPDPTNMDSAITTKGATNYAGYSNPQIDSLLAQAGATLQQSQRKAIYTQVQKMLAQDLPYVPTAWYPNSLVIDKTYGNVNPSVIGPLWNVGAYTLASS